MTEPEITPAPEATPMPEATPEAEAPGGGAILAAAGGAAVLAEDPEERKRRRRKALLLFFLLLLAALVLLFGGLYLWLRKPVTEMPIPGLVTEPVPHYSYSIYGVTKPTGVAVSPSGDRVYVTETDGERIVRIFDGKGTPMGTIKPPAATGAEHTPVYVALDPTNGDVYVSDRPTGSIYVYNRDGLWRRTFDPGKDLKGWQPLGLGFDAKGNLYVTDVSGPFNTVHEFGPDGALIRTIGEAGMFSFPNGVSVDAAGNLYVTDSNHGRLVVFDAGGKQRAVIKRGPGQGDLGLPRGTAVDDTGRVYVVDTSSHSVQLYRAITDADRLPKFIGSFGVEGSEDGGFEFPFGVATDTRARVYVADWNNDRVQVWSY